VQDAACFGLECAGIELLELLIGSFERELVNVICDGKFFDPGFEFGDFCFGRGNDEVKSVDVGGLCLAADMIYVDVWWNFNVPFCDRFEECRLDPIV
jgi:hypothetical protein